jgi:ADP-dependent phosphofructokinase/glucokinase
MPREAKLFASSAGSAVRAFLKFRANIPPRWIKNARNSRKRIEPDIVAGFRSLRRLQKDRPRARVAIRNAQRELREVLDHWEVAYEKEEFYRGIRVLLELQRNGMSRL